jgi:hypothetical protein
MRATLLDQLRVRCGDCEETNEPCGRCKQEFEAADEIETLQTEIERWREAFYREEHRATDYHNTNALCGHPASCIRNTGDGAKCLMCLQSAEIERLREIIGTTQDGVLVTDCEHFFCPKCGNECWVNIDLAYCNHCPNPDDGSAEPRPPLPMFMESCYSSRKASEKARNP